MKLSELLTEKTVQHSGNIKHAIVKYLPNLERADRIGGGLEADVYKAKDANSVIKDLWIDGGEDSNATYHYIDMIMSHQNNIFFPKIYNATLYMRSEDAERKKLIIQMERLHSFDSAKTEHLLPQLIQQMGISKESIDDMLDNELSGIYNKSSSLAYNDGDAENDELQRDSASSTAGVQRSSRLRAIGRVIYNKFDGAEDRAEFIKIIKNPQLKEAIILTDQVISKTNKLGAGRTATNGDLHSSNMMIRLTGTGPQLVITDPVISFAE